MDSRSILAGGYELTSLFSSPVAAILLDTAADAVGTESASKLSSYATILMLVAMVAIFYFFLYRPQKKKQERKRQNAFGF